MILQSQSASGTRYGATWVHQGGVCFGVRSSAGAGRTVSMGTFSISIVCPHPGYRKHERCLPTPRDSSHGEEAVPHFGHVSGGSNFAGAPDVCGAFDVGPIMRFTLAARGVADNKPEHDHAEGNAQYPRGKITH
jgi:hypothetical protein